MKFAYASDLHLDIIPTVDVPNLTPMMEGVDALLLAGDVTECQLLKKGSMSVDMQRFEAFFEPLVELGKPVLWVFGNHEFYGDNFDTCRDKVRQVLADCKYDNVVVLENETVDFGNCSVVGSTMWTNFDRGNPVVMEVARNAMNDYRQIFKGRGSLLPSDVYAEHQKSIEYITDQLTKADKPVIVLTHHHPTIRSYHGLIDYCYGSDFNDILLDHKWLSHWVCGHTHEQLELQLGNAVMLTNARGYGPLFEPKLHREFYLRTFEVI